MNVLERIECDSSADSDLSEEECEVSKTSDATIHSEDCGSSHELDIVESSSSNSTSRSACLDSVSNSSLQTSSGVSLLSGCCEELPLKKSSINYHIKSAKHEKCFRKGELMTKTLHSP